MTQTSLAGFLYVLPVVSERQREVLEALACLGSANDKMISVEVGLPINQVTPRRGELVDKGLVESCGVYSCPFSKRQSTFWRVV